MKPGKKGLGRIIDALKYSSQGLKAAWQHEAAFRQEVLLIVIMLPAAFWLGNSPSQVVVLIACLVLVIICELANSALEAVVDRFGGEIHPLSGRAKDIGSAMVLIALLFTLFVWVFIIYHNFFAS